MTHAINVRLQNPGKYNLYGRNCTAFVEDVLRAGGLNPIDTIFPLNLADSLTPHPAPPPKQPVPCGGFFFLDYREQWAPWADTLGRILVGFLCVHNIV